MLQVVIAPRLTPPSVTGIKANTTGAGLFSRLSSSFGYLNKQVRIRLKILDFGFLQIWGCSGSSFGYLTKQVLIRLRGVLGIQTFEGWGLLGQRHGAGPLLPPVQLLWLP